MDKLTQILEELPEAETDREKAIYLRARLQTMDTAIRMVRDFGIEKVEEMHQNVIADFAAKVEADAQNIASRN